MKQQGAIVALAALGALAALSARQARRELPSWSELSERLAPQGEVEIVGAPASIEPNIRAALEGEKDLAAKNRAVAEKFPFLAARIDRSWLGKRARMIIALRAVVARAAGVAPRFLGADGTVFAAPEEFYPGPLPLIDLSGVDAAKAAALAPLLDRLAQSGKAPARLIQARYSAPQQAWVLAFEGGTEVVWGELSWTEEKLERLAQVLDDARKRDPALAAPSVDMRYFGDGKILIRGQGRI